MEIQKSNGKYNVKETGETIQYDFEYQVIDSVQDCIDSIDGGEAKVKSLLQRILKVDANNVAREKAKALNGHSSRKVLSEEEKAGKKKERALKKQLLDLIEAKGLSIDDIAGM